MTNHLSVAHVQMYIPMYRFKGEIPNCTQLRHGRLVSGLVRGHQFDNDGRSI